MLSKVKDLLFDTDIVAPDDMHDKPWLTEVLRIVTVCGG